MLFQYMRETSRFLRDSRQKLVDPGDIVDYINRSRREVAMRSQCLRLLTPISGAITSFTINSGGTNYTSPTVTISAPDFPSGLAVNPNGLQATATATQSGGVINAVNVLVGGAGYYQPTVTIVDPTGSGADVAANVSGLNLGVGGQEVYNFSSVDLSAQPGLSEVYAVKSISVLYSNYRYSLECYSFSTYQAMIRNYPFQYQYVPFFCCQYGQGVSGSLLLYPIFSAAYQMEWDCFCLPSDMTADTDPEPIPLPWTDAVAYYAAYLAFLELQNHNFARSYLEQFNQLMPRFGGYARPGRAINPTGRPSVRTGI